MFVAWLVLVAALSGYAEQDSSKQDDCTHPQILLDASGKAIRLSSKEAQKRIIHCEPAKLPGTMDAKGVVLLIVLIDPEGKVHCATALNGHPLVRKFAMDAVTKWRFKPVERSGKRGAVYGVVSVRVSWDPHYGKDSCSKK